MEEPTPELDPREKRRSAVSGEVAAHPPAAWRDRHGLSMKMFGADGQNDGLHRLPDRAQ